MSKVFANRLFEKAKILVDLGNSFCLTGRLNRKAHDLSGEGKHEEKNSHGHHQFRQGETSLSVCFSQPIEIHSFMRNLQHGWSALRKRRTPLHPVNYRSRQVSV